MSMTDKLETVRFTTKGQVVIPLRLRKQFDIEDGTKAVVQATPGGYPSQTRDRGAHQARARDPEAHAWRQASDGGLGRA